jgi:hypothetical protein
MRPRAFRPAVFPSRTRRDFSGVRLVTSSKLDTLWNRRPGDVGLYFLTGIDFVLLSALGSRLFALGA